MLCFFFLKKIIFKHQADGNKRVQLKFECVVSVTIGQKVKYFRGGGGRGVP